MQNNLLKNSSKDLINITFANIITNIPRAGFNILLYFIITHLILSLTNNEIINFEILKKYSFYYIQIFLIYVILSVWSQTKNYVKAYEIASNIRLKLGEKLKKIPINVFKQKKSNNIALKSLESVQQSEIIISKILPNIASALIVPIILIFFLSFLNLFLGLFMLFSVLLASFFLFISTKIINKMGEKHLKIKNKASFEILEYLKNIKLLKSYNLIGKKFKSMDNSILELNKMTFKLEIWAGIPMQIFLFILDISYLSIFGIAIYFYISGNLSIQNLVAFAILSYYFYEPLKSIGTDIIEMKYALISTKFIENILNIPELKHKNIQIPQKNNIKFTNVEFGYNKNCEVLKGINFEIKEKSITALVGSSGAGKSTITNLITRFWETSKGKITLGETDIKNISSEELLKKISQVFQEVYLFNDTILNNIKIGKKDATKQEIINAAKLARCHNFIEKLPNGYDTIITQNGNSLSGGQKQRLSIARAILKDAPIIILDEATASLDPENESEIQKAIEKLLKDKTVIIIAHCFNSIINANQILVLQNGIISEKGTHKNLINSNGLYSKLWQEQQKSRGWKFKN